MDACDAQATSMCTELKPFVYDKSNGSLKVLDQLLLPLKEQYVDVRTIQDGWNVIKEMKVRGANAIANSACYTLAVVLRGTTFEDAAQLQTWVTDQLLFLTTARPTAVIIMDLAKQCPGMVKDWMATGDVCVDSLKERLITALEEFVRIDGQQNKMVGDNGAEMLTNSCTKKKFRMLTHCNTGPLATGHYGTALGVINSLHSSGCLDHAYCTETRPYLQGSRLTALELMRAGIPSTLICDSMAASLMQAGRVDAVVVGADRIALNGDTANKIGTCQLAIVARHHHVPFYVAATLAAVDTALGSGEDIVIEERPHEEMTHIKGQPIAPLGVQCWNPAFDVTPAELVTKFITEIGVFEPHCLREAALNRVL